VPGELRVEALLNKRKIWHEEADRWKDHWTFYVTPLPTQRPRARGGEGELRIIAWLRPQGVPPDGIRKPEKITRVCHVGLNPQDMPLDWRAYLAVDAVVLGNITWEKLDPGRIRALLRWARWGGRLTVHAGTTLPGLPDLTPGDLGVRRAGSMARVRYRDLPSDLKKLEGASELENTRIGCRTIALGNGAETGKMGRFTALSGQGLGSVTATCIDLEDQVLRQCAGYRLITESAVLGLPAEWTCNVAADGELEFSSLGEEYDQFGPGYDDPYAGRGAPVPWGKTLEEMAEVGGLPFLAVATFAILYILAIGPLDYYVLRKLGRLRWTWVTTLGMVLIFSLGAHFVMREVRGTRSIGVHLAFEDRGDDGEVRRNTFSMFVPGRSRTFLAWTPREGVVLDTAWKKPDFAVYSATTSHCEFTVPVWSGMGLRAVEGWQDRDRPLPDAELVLADEVLDGRVALPRGGPRLGLLLVRGRFFPGVVEGADLVFDTVRGIPMGDFNHRDLPWTGAREAEVAFLKCVLDATVFAGTNPQGWRESLVPPTRFFSSLHWPKRIFTPGEGALILLYEGGEGLCLDEEKTRRRELCFERHAVALRGRND
jgi:hypothetical protein